MDPRIRIHIRIRAKMSWIRNIMIILQKYTLHGAPAAHDD
jgi:hypothetical protein